MTRILVTGGLGFLGSHLVEELLSDPKTAVHVVDDLSSSAVGPEWLPSNPRFTWSAMPLQTYLERTDDVFDHVYHLASVVGPAGVLPWAGEIVRRVVDDAYAVADSSEAWGARLLDVSTSEVYGGGVDGLCSETMPKVIQAETTARLEYAVAKLAAETALVNLTRRGLDAVIVRPFNIAGPRQSSAGGFVLPRFVEAALHDRPLTVFGDGSAVRAFTHVSDMARGLRMAMEGGTTGCAYNLGAPANRTSILKLAERVVALADGGSIRYVDPTTIWGPAYAEASDKYPDADKAKVAFGWEAARSLDDVIIDTITWARGRVAP